METGARIETVPKYPTNRVRGDINDLLERKSKIERLLNICGNETFRLMRTVGGENNS